MRILTVKDMSCQHCVQRITGCLQALALDFTVNLANKQVEINGNNEDVASAIGALDEIGYESCEQ